MLSELSVAMWIGTQGVGPRAELSRFIKAAQVRDWMGEHQAQRISVSNGKVWGSAFCLCRQVAEVRIMLMGFGDRCIENWLPQGQQIMADERMYMCKICLQGKFSTILYQFFLQILSLVHPKRWLDLGCVGSKVKGSRAIWPWKTLVCIFTPSRVIWSWKTLVCIFTPNISHQTLSNLHTFFIWQLEIGHWS